MIPTVRPIKITRNYLPHAEGSCLFELGKTKVLCAASVENKVPPHAEAKGQGWVTAEYAMLPRAGTERTARGRASSGGRVQEIQRLVGRSLRAVVNLTDLGPRTLILDCDVIRADGGTRCASINGAFIALVDALRKLEKDGVLPRWPIKNHVAAVSVGLVEGKPVLDLDYSKDVKAGVDMNVVMTETGRYVEIQGTAEGAVFSEKELKALLGLAKKGITQIVAAQKKSLGKFGKRKS